jgi:TetR/AcrR family transcriptional regulator
MRIKASTGERARSKAGAAPRQRAEQQRSQATRAAILRAALDEFAEKGFEAASIRSIAERTGFQHPVITYHYPTKDRLWRAVAEDTFERIREAWDRRAPEHAHLSPLERLRVEYHALFRHTVAFPEFHRFMRQEASNNNPRLQWVAKTVLKPLIDRLLPQIEGAQRQGLLPKIEPILFHYMMVSLTAALSEFGPEMRVTRRLDAENPKVTEAFWKLVDTTVFAARAPADKPRSPREAKATITRRRRQRA